MVVVVRAGHGIGGAQAESVDRSAVFGCGHVRPLSSPGAQRHPFMKNAPCHPVHGMKCKGKPQSPQAVCVLSLASRQLVHVAQTRSRSARWVGPRQRSGQAWLAERDESGLECWIPDTVAGSCCVRRTFSGSCQRKWVSAVLVVPVLARKPSARPPHPPGSDPGFQEVAPRTAANCSFLLKETS